MSRTSTKPRPQRKKRSRKRKKTSRLTIIVALLSLFYLLLLLPLLWLNWTADDWWLGTVFAYAPKVVFAIPPFVLLVGSILWHRKSLVINLVSIVLTAGLLMHLQLPSFSTPALPGVDNQIRLVTCNIQGFEPSFGAVLQEVELQEPNVVLFQESQGDNQLYDTWAEDWNVYREDAFVVASKFPLKHQRTCFTTAFAQHHGVDKRYTAVHVTIDAPDGVFHVVNLHLMTARHGLSTVTPGQILRGSAREEIVAFDALLQMEANEVTEFIREIPADEPLVIAGDFNTPSHTNRFESSWGFLRSAFEEVGSGYGYTAPNTSHTIWPDYTPWLRIDHILVNDVWKIHQCKVGTGKGSDHRMVFSVLSLPQKQEKQQ